MDHLEMWRLRRRIEYLEKVRPVGHTSLVTILIRPDDQMPRIKSLIADELRKANNIKSGQTRGSVQEGLRSIGEYLKMFKCPPPNGIACYFGSLVCEPATNEEKKLKMYFEPPRPLGTFVYHCDVDTRTDALRDLLKDLEAIGFIVMDGKGAMLAVVRGNEKTVKCRLQVDLPRKHNRGGQSAMRFARQREELRKNYLIQVCEKATQIYITDDKPNVVGLVLAGQAQFKEELEKSAHLDPRLRSVVKLTVTVAYGEHQGLSEAIKLSAETLGNLRLITEIKLVDQFLSLIHKGRDDLVAYGVRDTMDALEEGSVLKLLVYDNLPILRYLLKDVTTGALSTRFVHSVYTPTSDEDVVEVRVLIDWLADRAMTDFGSKLELITDRSKEGSMLKLGFDGIAALLRYPRVQAGTPDHTPIVEDVSEDHF